MENSKLITKLREMSWGSCSTYKKTILKMAAQRITKLEAELKETKNLLADTVAALQKHDFQCEYCIHKDPPAPCGEDDERYTCDNCTHDCYCKDCRDNSKWEYSRMTAKKEENKCEE